VIDAFGFLFDDRAFVEILRGEMGGGTDDFYAALVSLVIGPRAFETGQEGVVDVDNAAGMLRTKFVGENLHVAGKNDEFAACAFDQCADLLFLIVFGFRRDRQMVEFDTMAFDEGALVSWFEAMAAMSMGSCLVRQR
jgi:hypothetical protein